MSTIDDQDKFMIQRGLTTYQLPASDMSTIRDDDLFLIARGSDHYKVSGADVLAQLGGGGGGGTRASFNILDGPGAGTTVDLLDLNQCPEQSFLFTPGNTYQLEFMDTFICKWDLVGQGGHGANGRTGKEGASYPAAETTDTSLIFPAWSAIAGAGKGGYGTTGGTAGSGTGGIAQVSGTVPGLGADGAVIAQGNGSGGTGGEARYDGQSRPSIYPAGGIAPANSKGEGNGGSGAVASKEGTKNGGGGGGGSAAYVRLTSCQMTRRSQCLLTVGGDNALAGIEYMRPALALLNATIRGQRAPM